MFVSAIMQKNSSDNLTVFILYLPGYALKKISECVLNQEKLPETQDLQAWDCQQQQMQSSPIAFL